MARRGGAGRWTAVLAGGTGLAVALVAYWMLLPNEEERIRRVLADAAGSAVEQDVRGVVAPLAKDFLGPRGTNQEAATLAVQRTFQLGFSSVQVQLQELSVEVTADEQRAHTRMRPVVRAQRAGVAGDVDILAYWRMSGTWDMEWVQRDGRWEVRSLAVAGQR